MKYHAFLFFKLGKMFQNLSSAAVVIEHLGIDSSTDRMIGIRSVLKSIPKC